MQTDHAIRQLELRHAEALAIAGGDDNARSFDTWKPLSRLTLERIYGPGHSILGDWDKIRCSLSLYTTSTTREDSRRARQAGVRRAAALLEAAIEERHQLAATVAHADGDAVDAELWQHIEADVSAACWSQAAANTAVCEEQGWQQLATGFVQALSNVDRHRIQDRGDAKAYAMGVVGTSSLIITQLRYQHGTRFRSGA